MIQFLGTTTPEQDQDLLEAIEGLPVNILDDCKHLRGFGSLVKRDPKRQRELAAKGGRRGHELGTAHQFTPEEARAAGRKGGLAAAAARRRKKLESETT